MILLMIKVHRLSPVAGLVDIFASSPECQHMLCMTKVLPGEHSPPLPAPAAVHFPRHRPLRTHGGPGVGERHRCECRNGGLRRCLGLPAIFQATPACCVWRPRRARPSGDCGGCPRRSARRPGNGDGRSARERRPLASPARPATTGSGFSCDQRKTCGRWQAAPRRNTTCCNAGIPGWTG